MANKTTKHVTEVFSIEDFRPKNFSPLKDQKSKIFPGRMVLCSSATNVVQCPGCKDTMHLSEAGIVALCNCGLRWSSAGNDNVIVDGSYKEEVEN